MQVLRLKKTIIYGPVNSRRLGRSLGINLSPTRYKVCNFNCVYCHYGWTKYLTSDLSDFKNELPEPEDVKKALENFLQKKIKIDYITFSGDGEPTLHPDFEKIVDLVIEIKDKLSPQTKIALLSNSSTLDKKEVIDALKKVDLPILKLDCGNEETFKKVNRPCSLISFDQIVENLKNVGDIVIQTMLVDGENGNVKQKDIDDWIEKIGMIKPRWVQLYSLENPPADGSLGGVGKNKLEKIAKQTEKKTGVRVEVY